MTTSSPGRIGLVRIHGVPGSLIEFGQWLNGDGFTEWEHAFLDLGDGTVIEAEPGGARIRPLSEYDDTEVYWCDAIYSQVSPAKRQLIADEAKKLVGTPYSAADYFALAAHRLDLPVPGLKGYIQSSRHLICSQLVDLAYQLGGFQIFSDHRWDGYVTPGALYQADRVVYRWDTITWDMTWSVA